MTLSLSISAWLIPAEAYELFWQVPKHFETSHLLYGLLIAVVFLLGGLAGDRALRLGRGQEGFLAGIRWEHLLSLYHLFVFLCSLGSVALLLTAVRNGLGPGMVLDILRGQGGAIYAAKKAFGGGIPGLTTMSQLGMGAVIMGAVLVRRFGWRPILPGMVLLFGFAFVRALLGSERLALIELIVPLLIALLPRIPDRSGCGLREPVPRGTLPLLALAPLVAIPLLYCVFTGMEYFRSWLTFYSKLGLGINVFQFGAIRLAGYYVTALNNGALWINHSSPPMVPWQTAMFFWQFPMVDKLISITDLAGRQVDYKELLAMYGSIEFNNPTALFMPAIDFGILGAAGYWFGFGFGSRVLHRLWVEGRLSGLLLYPFLFTALLEMCRAPYAFLGRSLPTWIILLIASNLCTKRGRELE